ncbi:MAG: hypothetical protein ABIX01_04900 [Chitinophagaceae bacterium]
MQLDPATYSAGFLLPVTSYQSGLTVFQADWGIVIADSFSTGNRQPATRSFATTEYQRLATTNILFSQP